MKTKIKIKNDAVISKIDERIYSSYVIGFVPADEL